MSKNTATTKAQKANAQLIADLLEACQQAKKILVNDGYWGTEIEVLLTATIAKAGGRESGYR